MTGREIVDLTLQVHHKTEKAILVSDDGDPGNAVWLALSQIEVEEKGGGVVKVQCPVWLAKDKGLV